MEGSPGNAGLLGQFADLLGAQVAALRLLISILLGFPLAYLHRRYLYNSEANVQHLFFFFSGFVIGFWNYGWTIFHPISAILVTYAILVLTRGSHLTVILSFVFNMGYLLTGYYQTNTENYDIKWTMPQCVLALKLIGLAFDVHDGALDESKLSKAQKLSALKELPSLLELLGFANFPGSFLVGPIFGLKKYRDYVNGKLIPDEKRDSDGNRLPPDCIEPTVQRTILGIIYLSVFQIGTVYMSDRYLLSDEYGEQGFFKRCFLLGIWGRINLYKYISCWLFTEAVCTAFGLSYNGKDKDGRATWDGLANVKLITFENATEFNHYIQSFNINTNYWCAEYIYKRVKFLGSKLYSQIAVLVFLAIWHGLHSGYYLCFLMEFLIMYCEKEVKPIFEKFGTLQRLYNNNLPFKGIVWALLKVYTFVFMGYSLIPFVLLSYPRYMIAYKNVYFVGHIFFISVAVGAFYIKKSLRSAERRSRAD